MRHTRYWRKNLLTERCKTPAVVLWASYRLRESTRCRYFSAVHCFAAIQRWAGKSVLQLTNELLCSHSVSGTGILGCFFLNVRIMWNPWNDHVNYVRYGEFHDAILLYCKRAHLHPSFAWTKQLGHADTFFSTFGVKCGCCCEKADKCDSVGK